MFDCPTLKNQLTSAKFCLHNYIQANVAAKISLMAEFFPHTQFPYFLFVSFFFLFPSSMIFDCTSFTEGILEEGFEVQSTTLQASRALQRLLFFI